MATKTQNYKLTKIDLTDVADITALNENFDTIDAELDKKLDASDKPTLQSLGGVPTSRTVNGKPLSSDITLSADDVGASKSNHTHTMSDISGTLPVSKGGTGASTLTNGAALIGGGTSPVSTRNITHNTAVTATIPSNSNLITANTLLVALNRNTSVGNADTAYAAYMARGIALLTSAPVSLENGCCAFIYQ